MAWGWRVPFLLSVLVIIAGYIIRRGVEETPAFARRGEAGWRAARANSRGVPAGLGGHAARGVHVADERHPRR